jgi:hypothetical protein
MLLRRSSPSTPLDLSLRRNPGPMCVHPLAHRDVSEDTHTGRLVLRTCSQWWRMHVSAEMRAQGCPFRYVVRARDSPVRVRLEPQRRAQDRADRQPSPCKSPRPCRSDEREEVFSLAPRRVGLRFRLYARRYSSDAHQEAQGADRPTRCIGSVAPLTTSARGPIAGSDRPGSPRASRALPRQPASARGRLRANVADRRGGGRPALTIAPTGGARRRPSSVRRTQALPPGGHRASSSPGAGGQADGSHGVTLCFVYKCDEMHASVQEQKQLALTTVDRWKTEKGGTE